MNLLRVTNIQRGCIHDGPGVRTTVFLKGCSMQCPWCCNPETISFEEQWFIDDERCIFLHGNTSHLCDACERLHGQRSIKECPFGVCEKASNDYNPEELFAEIVKDKALFMTTGGGVTFSGGEPLLQAESLLPLLAQLKEEEIDVAFETTLMTSPNSLSMVFPYSSLYIIDLKLQPQMALEMTDYLHRMEEQLFLTGGANKLFRMVFVNQIVGSEAQVLNLLQRLGVKNLELLLCHNLGQKKYVKLLKENSDYTADPVLAEGFSTFLCQNGIDTSVLSV